ncbi:MAG: hypothetical protein ACETWK_07130 [Candidatus Aminicenantaceae bacterium]
MKVFYPRTITKAFLKESIANQIEGDILHYQLISSERIKEPYRIKNKDYADYLNRVKEITDDVGDFIKDCLLIFSSQRKDFRYIRKKSEFLTKHENLLKIKVKTDKADKLVKMRLEQPSFVLIPLVLFKARGQSLYIIDHYNSKISYVISNPENPLNDDYFVDNAMEELWHVALYPYLVEKENSALRKGKPLDDKNFKKMLVKEGERLSRLFTFASIDEFRLKKDYEYIKSERIPEKREKFLMDEIKRIGIKRSLKEVRKSKGFLDFRRET